VAAGRARAPAAPALVSLTAARRTQARSAADALTRQAGRVLHRLQVYRRWGLRTPPPVPPAPPADPPRLHDGQVIHRVPTDEKVVFLTIDDGSVKDPAFLRMVRELHLPVTSFLTDEEARTGRGYAYFRALAALGGGMQNHTLTHPGLPGLDTDAQRREICGQQQILARESGRAPRLLRPPYGEYDTGTLEAARACGLDGLVLWGMEAWPDHIDYAGVPGRLYPGAIILAHYRGPDEWGGTMVEMARRVLRLAAAQGYAVARLEDYV
jgi:peptidoglycan/xylan/chitin deacetylase (PgdA/CDA1 family)